MLINKWIGTESKLGWKSHCTHCTDAVTCWFSKFPSVMWAKMPCHWCHLMSLKVQWVTWKNEPHYTRIHWYSTSYNMRAMSVMCFRHKIFAFPEKHWIDLTLSILVIEWSIYLRKRSFRLRKKSFCEGEIEKRLHVSATFTNSSSRNYL